MAPQKAASLPTSPTVSTPTTPICTSLKDGSGSESDTTSSNSTESFLGWETLTPRKTECSTSAPPPPVQHGVVPDAVLKSAPVTSDEHLAPVQETEAFFTSSSVE